MSRYLYNAAYFWELVVDKRSPEGGTPVYLEERSTGKRRFLKNIEHGRDLEPFCRAVQMDLYLSEEDFEAKYEVTLSPHVEGGPLPAVAASDMAEADPSPAPL
jgi:hypothetical protein